VLDASSAVPTAASQSAEPFRGPAGSAATFGRAAPSAGAGIPLPRLSTAPLRSRPPSGSPSLSDSSPLAAPADRARAISSYDSSSESSCSPASDCLVVAAAVAVAPFAAAFRNDEALGGGGIGAWGAGSWDWGRPPPPRAWCRLLHPSITRCRLACRFAGHVGGETAAGGRTTTTRRPQNSITRSS
jgi:hypothetical protein